jgi:hypothetical protein
MANSDNVAGRLPPKTTDYSDSLTQQTTLPVGGSRDETDQEPLLQCAKAEMETRSLPAAQNDPPKLRWYQWRLRTMFLLTLLVAVGMSWLTVTIQSQRKQRATARAIGKAKGVGSLFLWR